MSVLEDSIAVETEYIKEVYAKASKSMSESQHYFLNGVQASPVAKSYLLTKKVLKWLEKKLFQFPPLLMKYLTLQLTLKKD
jgi:hypothetical protein